MRKVRIVLARNCCPCSNPQLVSVRFVTLIISQFAPASSVMKILSDPSFATPTKIRGVGFPIVPEVLSNVTNAIPVKSLSYPVRSLGSGA